MKNKTRSQRITIFINPHFAVFYIIIPADQINRLSSKVYTYHSTVSITNIIISTLLHRRLINDNLHHLWLIPVGMNFQNRIRYRLQGIHLPLRPLLTRPLRHRHRQHLLQCGHVDPRPRGAQTTQRLGQGTGQGLQLLPT